MGLGYYSEEELTVSKTLVPNEYFLYNGMSVHNEGF
jgi:hypothetical protein